MGKKLITAIYIGDEFYQLSKSMMSPVYLESGSRYDWGFMQRDLREGHEVRVRQATETELNKYKVKLADLIISREKK
jgi:hypothetical protein